MRNHSRQPEDGFAMLLVFLMAALIAIALYNELPRLAFESQRAKEQLLIERGEQYKRAIQLFVRKVNRYPATIEELESTNNIRFLRKRYLDPITGKEKWRLIHINGGVLTDSIIQKGKPGQDQPKGNTNTFIGEAPVMGASTDPNQQQANGAMRRRASDDRPVVTQEVPDEPQPEADPNQEVADNNDTTDNDDAAVPGTPVAAVPPVRPVSNMPPGRVPYPPGMTPPGMNPAFPGQTGVGGRIPVGQAGGVNLPGMVMPGNQSGQDDTNNQGGFPQPSYPGQTSTSSVYAPQPGVNPGQQPGVYPQQPGAYPGQQPGAYPGQQPGAYPGQQAGVYPQQPGFPGQQQGVYPQQPGFPGQQQGVYPQQPGYPGQSPGTFGQPATAGFGAGSGGMQNGQNTAAQMINNALMGPRPGGMQGLPGMGGTQIGGGIAGVASESGGPSIIVYNERKKYNEWEFVYDQSKDRGLAGVSRGGGAPGTPAGQMGNMPGSPVGSQQPGGSFGSGNNSFGSAPGSFGSGPGGGSFGQSSPGFGQSTPQPPPPAPQQPPN